MVNLENKPEDELTIEELKELYQRKKIENATLNRKLGELRARESCRTLIIKVWRLELVLTLP